MRAPISQLSQLEELHSRLRLISECVDHMICGDGFDSFSASKEDVLSKEEEDAVATALFPDIAKHLGEDRAIIVCHSGFDNFLKL